MWLNPMLRVETYLTPARLSASRVEPVTGVLWPTLMHRFPDASSMLASDTAASVITGITPKRGATSRNAAASSGPHPYTVIPMPGTAEEDADAAGRARRAAGRAGSLEVMPPSQGSRVLPARMRFSIHRRNVADRSVREHITGHRRPLRHPGMIPLSLREIAAAVGRTVDGDSGARRRQASDQPGTPRFHRHSRLYRLPHDRGAGGFVPRPPPPPPVLLPSPPLPPPH